METPQKIGRSTTPEETSQVAQAVYLRSIRKLSHQDNKLLNETISRFTYRLETAIWPGEKGDTELEEVLRKLFKKYSHPKLLANARRTPIVHRKKRKGR